MYFATAEKRHDSFFEQWSSRVVGLDCSTSFLYFTSVPKQGLIGSMFTTPKPELPVTLPLSESVDDISDHNNSTTLPPSAAGNATARAPASPATPDPPSPPQAEVPIFNPRLVWKKAKVVSIVPIAREEWFSDYGRESFYVLQLSCESIQSAHFPPYPNLKLLCSSSGLGNTYGREEVLTNPQHLYDPYLQKDIYEGIRDLFAIIRREREMNEIRMQLSTRNESGTFSESTSRADSERISNSPRARSLGVTPLSEEPKIQWPRGSYLLQLRFSSEFEYWRFFYVTSFMLGMNGKFRRPFCGFPPYDPRNKIAYVPFPVCLWRRMKWLSRYHYPYIYIYGSLMGLMGSQKKLGALSPKSYFSVTHDYVIVLNAMGEEAQWVSLNFVHTMFYNADCKAPYFVLLSDENKPDVIFEARINEDINYWKEESVDTGGEPASQKEKQALAHLYCRFQVRRLAFILHRSCFGTVETRRVIRIEETDIPSVEKWTQWKLSREAVITSEAADTPVVPPPLEGLGILDTAIRRKDYPPLPRARTSFRDVWNRFGSSVSQLNQNQVHSSLESVAVPLYETNVNTAPLTPRQFNIARNLLERESEEDGGIVGIAIDSVEEVETILDSRQTARRASGTAHEWLPAYTQAPTLAYYDDMDDLDLLESPRDALRGGDRLTPVSSDGVSLSRVRYFRENPTENDSSSDGELYSTGNSRYLKPTERIRPAPK